jgi:hypothetical protein
MIKLENFEEAVKAGKIKNYKPYLKSHLAYRVAMAELGVGVKELVELNDSYINKLLVQNNHAQEYWDEWIKKGSEPVKLELIDKEYKLDQFVQHSTLYVRYCLIDQHPQFIPQIITKSKDDYQMIFNKLQSKRKPDVSHLALILDYYDMFGDKRTKLEYEAYKIKYVGLQTTPNIIERTIDTVDLFLTNNPLWSRDYTVAEIQDVIVAYKKATRDNNDTINREDVKQILVEHKH